MIVSPMLEDHAPDGEPDAETVGGLEALCVAGRYLDALAESARFAPFERWSEPHARGVAYWLCEALEAPRRARAIALGTIRRAPRAPAARIVRLQMILETRGPLDAWEAIRREAPFGEEATDEDRADLHMLEACALTGFHDFERAVAATRRAEEAGGAARRIAMMLARIAMQRDRYAEGLEAAERARALAPDNTDANLAVAHLRVLLGDRDGALALLREVAARTQSAALAMHLVSMLRELRLFEERDAWVERWAARAPLLEDTDRLLCLRADSAFDRGDFGEALRLAASAKSPFFTRVAATLAQKIHDPSARRVQLDVPFVRQHAMTCAPATLTALATYWRMPADHLAIADAICYDGTPCHSQRTWAEEHGFHVRELTVTWDAARALLDRGVPFTVAIVQSASAHLQAIVGYDDRRGTFFLRDPFIPQVIEARADEWLATWRATGPYGMAMVPAAEAARLDGIALPDAPLHDALHRTLAALERHDRDAASAACDALVAEAPGHRLAIAARRALAAYDQDPARVLACAEEVAAAFPDFVPARLEALACMRAVRGVAARMEAAEALVAAHPEEPLYAEALARELADDARNDARTARLLRRAIRGRPDRHAALVLLSQRTMSSRSADDALAVARFAACLGRFDESAAYAYFLAARAAGRDGEAIALLRARAAELGGRATGPVRTLFAALDALGRSDEGLRALDAAIEARTGDDDGELLLLAADARASFGELAAARALLGRAESCSKRTEWLRVAARIALQAGAIEEHARLLDALIAREPLDVGAHALRAAARAAHEGAAAAQKHLEAACARAPHFRALAHVRLDWLRGAGAATMERVARELLGSDPTDARLHHELALALLQQKRLDEAHAALARAAEIAPRDASTGALRALALRREGRREEAREALRAVIELDPDRSDAIAELVASAEDADERARTSDALEARVLARSVTGAGVLAWLDAVQSLHDPARLLAVVDRLREERPGLAAAWGCAIRQRSSMGRSSEAIALADEACARFPLVAAIWTERADALAPAGKDDEAIRSLEQAVQIDSTDEAAHVRLAQMYVRRGARARARELLGRAIGRAPASTRLRAELAEIAWAEGAHDDALAKVEAILALQPADERAWELFDRWSTEQGRAAEGLARLERLCAERPWSGLSKLNLARARLRRDDTAGALAALDEAIAFDPLLFEAHDLRASVLAFLERFDEAEAACAPAAYAGDPPRELRGRAAWVKGARGDTKGAVAAMRALLAEHPDYAWGWIHVAQWERERGAPVEALEAARRVAVAAPRAASGQLLLARGLFAVGDRIGAKRALARAVDLAPADEAAPAALFDALLDDGELAQAESLVPTLRAIGAAAGLAAEARLRARTGEAEEACRALRALALEAGADAARIERARRGCILSGLASQCEALFVELVELPGAHAAVGQIWVRTLVMRDDLTAVQRSMRYLDPTLPAVRAAAAEWLTLLGERDAPGPRRDAALLVRERFAPCDDDALWAQIASALLACGAFDACEAWTHDWRARTNATPAMLLPAASCRRELAANVDALAIVRHAAPLEPADGASPSHRAWLAFELAASGERDEARRWLTAAGDVRKLAIVSTVSELTEAMLAVQGGAGESDFGRARALLASSRARCVPDVLVRAHARASRRVAEDVGFPFGTIWANRASLRVLAVVACVIAFMALLLSVPDLPAGSMAPVLIGLIAFSRQFFSNRRTS